MGTAPAWNKHIHIANIAKYLQTALTAGDYPIVSVGSGTGIHEAALEDLLKRPIICVDPAPHTFEPLDSDAKEHLPDYPLVTDLVRSKPEIVGKCHVLVIWPIVDMHAKSCYITDAIDVLNPATVTVLYESLGSAGFTSFRCWIYKIGGPTITDGEKLMHAEKKCNCFISYKHQLVGALQKRIIHEEDAYNYSLILLGRLDCDVDRKNLPVGITGEEIPPRHMMDNLVLGRR
jgi:hypothetical protein